MPKKLRKFKPNIQHFSLLQDKACFVRVTPPVHERMLTYVETRKFLHEKNRKTTEFHYFL